MSKNFYANKKIIIGILGQGKTHFSHALANFLASYMDLSVAYIEKAGKTDLSYVMNSEIVSKSGVVGFFYDKVMFYLEQNISDMEAIFSMGYDVVIVEWRELDFQAYEDIRLLRQADYSILLGSFYEYSKARLFSIINNLYLKGVVEVGIYLANVKEDQLGVIQEKVPFKVHKSPNIESINNFTDIELKVLKNIYFDCVGYENSTERSWKKGAWTFFYKRKS